MRPPSLSQLLLRPVWKPCLFITLGALFQRGTGAAARSLLPSRGTVCWLAVPTIAVEYESMQGYVLTLWDCQISLLGLGYLAILALVLIWPPQRDRYEELDHHGRPVTLGDSCLPLLLRNEAAEACALLPRIPLMTAVLRKRHRRSSAPQTTIVVQQNCQPFCGHMIAVEPVWGH